MVQEEELDRVRVAGEDGAWLTAVHLRLVDVEETGRGPRRRIGSRRWQLATGEPLRLIDASTFVVQATGEILTRLPAFDKSEGALPPTGASGARHIRKGQGRTHAAPYRSSPVFTAETLPQSLQSEHRTERGAWAVLHVLAGSIRVVREATGATTIVTPHHPHLIRPDEPHHVERIGPVSLRLDFFDHEPAGAEQWTS